MVLNIIFNKFSYVKWKVKDMKINHGFDDDDILVLKIYEVYIKD